MNNKECRITITIYKEIYIYYYFSFFWMNGYILEEL